MLRAWVRAFWRTEGLVEDAPAPAVQNSARRVELLMKSRARGVHRVVTTESWLARLRFGGVPPTRAIAMLRSSRRVRMNRSRRIVCRALTESRDRFVEMYLGRGSPRLCRVGCDPPCEVPFKVDGRGRGTGVRDALNPRRPRHLS